MSKGGGEADVIGPNTDIGTHTATLSRTSPARRRAGAAISRPLIAELLRLIDGLRPAPFLAFEAPYFIFFLKYLLASSLSALPAVKRGCRVAGLALKVAGSPVNGLIPLRDLVAPL